MVYRKEGIEALRNVRFKHFGSASEIRDAKARIHKTTSGSFEFEEGQIVGADDGEGWDLRFALAPLETGDIVDLQYRIRRRSIYSSEYTILQKEWPTRRRLIRIRPHASSRYDNFYGPHFARWETLNADPIEIQEKANGFYEVVVGNMNTFAEEPYSLPKEKRAAGFYFYRSSDDSLPGTYWIRRGKEIYRETRAQTKPGANIRSVLEQLITGGMDQDEKLKVLYDYCVSELINTRHGDLSALTSEQRNWIDSEGTAEKVLEQGYGSPTNINTVFLRSSSGGWI